MRLRIVNVAGARPNFMKIAPIIREMKRYQKRIEPLFVHTGQHFDREMSEFFLKDLDLPRPDFYLGVGTNSHASQTAGIMRKFERILLKTNPHLVLVVGDVNSTIACALCAAKLGIPVAHVEAGLRSFDRTMPEEINRVLTDAVADYLFITEESAYINLLKEGKCGADIYFVGNVMIDTLISHKKEADRSGILKRLKLKKKDYATLTLHRPCNVDKKKVFIGILEAINEIQKEITVVWPVHPRSRKMIERFGLQSAIAKMPNLKITAALGYLDFLKLMSNSRFVLTDSGGIQEEATILDIPCLTLRENTERPVTVEIGTNAIVGYNRDRIIMESRRILSGRFKKGRRPRLWDNKVAGRIVRILIKEMEKRNGAC